MLNTRSSLMAGAAMLQAITGGSLYDPITVTDRIRGLAEVFSNLPVGTTAIKRRGPGRGTAKVKRMAAKKRNQQRHRRACKAKGAR